MLTLELPSGSKNVVLAVVAFLLGYRGVQATLVYHRVAASVTVWKNVAVVVAAHFVAGTVVFLGALVVDAVASQLSERALTQWLGICWIAASLLVHLATRRRFPTVQPRQSSSD